MARIIIKESAIRQYVRSLIREALEAEAVEDPEDVAEREKMLSGQAYDRSKFAYGGKSREAEKLYRENRGLPPLRKPSGGVVPRLIDADGSDITPENAPEALQACIDARADKQREKSRKRYVKNSQKETFADSHNIDVDTLKKKRVTDSFANNAEKDPVASKLISMTPEERKAEAERIRRERIQKSVDDNRRFAEIAANITQNIEPRTKQYYLDRIEALKEKQKALGPRCSANEWKWNQYDMIIKDTERILRTYFGKNLNTINPLDHNEDDDIVNAAFNGINSDDMKQEFQNEFGDALVDTSEFNNGMQQDEEPKDNDDEETEDDDNEKPTFDELEKEWGFFDDDDFKF